MPDALLYLSTLERFGIKLGLDNIRTVLSALGHPERAFASVHIAGTNGKGSVTAMVDAALRAAGHRTGRYTSPHLVELRERFGVDGRPVDQAALEAVVTDLRSVIEGLLARGVLPVPPTFFEATTAIAFELFRRAGLEVAVCEVGLGGRLDATNVLTPVITAVTTISLDHQQHLGSTLREIAREKAGIIKPGVPVILGRLSVEATEEITAVARSRGSAITEAWDGTDVDLRDTTPAGAQHVRLRTPRRDYGEVTIALAGAHQIDNAVVAVRILESLDAQGVSVSADAIAAGLATVVWPGRMDRRVLADGREILLDAAHNAEGAAALAAHLSRSGRPLGPVIFAASRDKDAAAMLRALAPVATAFVLTHASHERGEDPQVLAAVARDEAPAVPLTVTATPHDALAVAWGMSPHIVAAGSIFLLGDVLSELGRS